MSLQIIANLNIDFYDRKYVSIEAKQYDNDSRFVLVTCYNQGKLFPINSVDHSAYIRYKKSDDYAVFNFCQINEDGKILVELTEQMLASEGICCADLVITNKGSAKVDTETGEIIAINNASILSTMTFYINVSGTSVDNSEIESSYEFNGFNEALEKAHAEYNRVMQLAKSYAVGNAGGIRENEDTDNSKYYYERSLESANNADESEANAKTSEENARTYMNNAAASEQDAESHMNNAKTYMDNAETYMNNAKNSETAAAASETNAANAAAAAAASEANAKQSENAAKTSETNASASEVNAAASEVNALNSANSAKSYAVGGTGIRENENNDNAFYYYEMVKAVANGFNSGFIPIGTVSFSELATAEKATGFTYNISDDFVTDNTFREGEGKPYTAGTNVFYTADGYWDCFGGSASATATVDEVKSYLSI